MYYPAYQMAAERIASTTVRTLFGDGVRRTADGTRLCIYDMLRVCKKAACPPYMAFKRLREKYTLGDRCDKKHVYGLRQKQWVCDEDTARAIVWVCPGIDPELRMRVPPPVVPLAPLVSTTVGGLYCLRMKFNPAVVKFGCSYADLDGRIASYRGFTAPSEVLLRRPMPDATKDAILNAEKALLAAADAIPGLVQIDGGQEWYEMTDTADESALVQMLK